MSTMFVDRKFRVPRKWSNRELKRFGSMFSGKVVNVSGWRDEDKEGGRYREYFPNASDYYVTNYRTEARGFTGTLDNEMFLDLSKPLPSDLVGAFDVVLNHTVLEHIFDFNKAFENLAKMTRDVLILVVPFLQEEHADYGDYWRFTPQAIIELIKVQGLIPAYLNYNDHDNASIYILAVAVKSDAFRSRLESLDGNKASIASKQCPGAGLNVVTNPWYVRAVSRIRKLVS